MSIRSISLSLAIACLPIYSGCDVRIAAPPSGSAAIVGSIVPTGASGKFATAAQLGCPDLVVTLDGAAVSIELDDDCTFLIDDVQPAAVVVLRIEVAALGVSGTVELTNVGAGELIEVLVEADDESLTLSVVRRAVPDPVDELPLVISGNNVTILIPAGIYDQTLTVDGNNFTLVGVAGEGCDDAGWSVITGEVIILKNNATFRNIRFDGPVEVHGNNTNFINTCFGSELVIFGNNTDVDDDDGDEDDNDHDDDNDEGNDDDD